MRELRFNTREQIIGAGIDSAIKLLNNVMNDLEICYARFNKLLNSDDGIAIIKASMTIASDRMRTIYDILYFEPSIKKLDEYEKIIIKIMNQLTTIKTDLSVNLIECLIEKELVVLMKMLLPEQIINEVVDNDSNDDDDDNHECSCNCECGQQSHKKKPTVVVIDSRLDNQIIKAIQSIIE